MGLVCFILLNGMMLLVYRLLRLLLFSEFAGEAVAKLAETMGTGGSGHYCRVFSQDKAGNKRVDWAHPWPSLKRRIGADKRDTSPARLVWMYMGAYWDKGPQLSCHVYQLHLPR